jgi:hypothetical protein
VQWALLLRFIMLTFVDLNAEVETVS